MPIAQGPIPNASAIFTVLRGFLLDVLGSGVDVVQAQDNRVPEPSVDDFVVMGKPRLERLNTNVRIPQDAKFVGSISGPTMTIASVTRGTVAVGDRVFGTNVASGTTVTALGTGTGGVGTYVVSPSQTVASGVISTGTMAVTQNTRVVVQLDVHGARAQDNAQVIATLLRDDYAARYFKVNGGAAAPLYADDPIQVPFTNDQNQWEDRYVVQAHLQANVTVTVPQEFADVVDVGLVPADIFYP